MSSPAWEHFKRSLCVCPEIGLTLDMSKTNFHSAFFTEMDPVIQKAYAAMERLESGALANPDENRMVGHYWLRDPERAPSSDICQEIQDTRRAIRRFSEAIQNGSIKPQKANQFTKLICIGIGGSALGPQFVADALGNASDMLKPYFLDNTDPDGFDRTLAEIGAGLRECLTIVISKSGGTIETRNGMIEVAEAYKKAGLTFEKHAVAVTGVGSKLDNIAKNGGWINRFPMWDWVGGRTSITSAVGLVPMSLQGLDIDGFIDGAAACDITRNKDTRTNPAALLALLMVPSSGRQGTEGHGDPSLQGPADAFSQIISSSWSWNRSARKKT